MVHEDIHRELLEKEKTQIASTSTPTATPVAGVKRKLDSIEASPINSSSESFSFEISLRLINFSERPNYEDLKKAESAADNTGASQGPSQGFESSQQNEPANIKLYGFDEDVQEETVTTDGKPNDEDESKVDDKGSDQEEGNSFDQRDVDPIYGFPVPSPDESQ